MASKDAIAPGTVVGPGDGVEPGDGGTPRRPVPSNPAFEVADLLEGRAIKARTRSEEIDVDLTVISEIGSLEAQLKEARLVAEREKLLAGLAKLEKAIALASTAAEKLEAFADEGRVRAVFEVLASRAEDARSAVDHYRRERAQKIALTEAQAPVTLSRVPLETEVSMAVGSFVASVDGKRRSDFLSLVYAVANELGVQVRSTGAGGREVWNSYATMLERPARAEEQMTLLALIAYRNRQNHKTDGTLLGQPLRALAASGAVTTARGRRYKVSEAAKEAYLTGALKNVWGELDIRVGTWDLAKAQRTAAALRNFSSGEFDTPDAQLLLVVSEILAQVEAETVADAIVNEEKRSHLASVSAAKRFDLAMEKTASEVFQADRILGNQSSRLGTVASCYAFFTSEAARLADPERAPRYEELRSHARAVREAAIGVDRAEHIAEMLLSYREGE